MHIRKGSVYQSEIKEKSNYGQSQKGQRLIRGWGRKHSSKLPNIAEVRESRVRRTI